MVRQKRKRVSRNNKMTISISQLISVFALVIAIAIPIYQNNTNINLELYDKRLQVYNLFLKTKTLQFRLSQNVPIYNQQLLLNDIFTVAGVFKGFDTSRYTDPLSLHELTPPELIKSMLDLLDDAMLSTNQLEQHTFLFENELISLSFEAVIRATNHLLTSLLHEFTRDTIEEHNLHYMYSNTLLLQERFGKNIKPYAEIRDVYTSEEVLQIFNVLDELLKQELKVSLYLF